MSRNPSQKMGMENPPTAKTITTRSSREPAFQAARIPSGMASRIANVSVLTASATVGSSRWRMSWRTGICEWRDLPRSPRRRLPA